MFERKIDKYWNFETSDTKEFTHCYHIYPAMMIPQVARKLIADYKPEHCNLLLDPYMGSGTSLVEANIVGINAIGTDINPLARLMSKVKTTHYDLSEISYWYSEICLAFNFYTSTDVKDTNFERISNYAFWYSEDSLYRLTFITQLINERVPEEFRDFFRVALSETVREVSFTRNGEFKRYRMTQERINVFKPDVFKIFEMKVIRNIKGLMAFNKLENNAYSRIFDFNSALEIPDDIIADGCIDMVVTSPPYGDSHTTVAYGQFSRWANEWFGFENAKNLDNLLMGGQKSKNCQFITESIKPELEEIKEVDPKRYKEVISFLDDYYFSIMNVAKKVRQGGRICYVVGNRRVKNVQINLDYFTAETFERFGFKHEITIVRDIPNKRMPAKNSPSNVVGDKVATMSNEFMVIMTKQ